MQDAQPSDLYIRPQPRRRFRRRVSFLWRTRRRCGGPRAIVNRCGATGKECRVCIWDPTKNK